MAKKHILTRIADALTAREQLQQDAKDLDKALKKAKAERAQKQKESGK